MAPRETRRELRKRGAANRAINFGDINLELPPIGRRSGSLKKAAQVEKPKKVVEKIEISSGESDDPDSDYSDSASKRGSRRPRKRTSPTTKRATTPAKARRVSRTQTPSKARQTSVTPTPAKMPRKPKSPEPVLESEPELEPDPVSEDNAEPEPYSLDESDHAVEAAPAAEDSEQGEVVVVSDDDDEYESYEEEEEKGADAEEVYSDMDPPDQADSPPSSAKTADTYDPPAHVEVPELTSDEAYTRSEKRVAESYERKIKDRQPKSHKRGPKKKNQGLVQIKYRRMPSNKAKVLAVDVIGQILSDYLSRKSGSSLDDAATKKDRQMLEGILSSYKGTVTEYFDSLVDSQLSNSLVLRDLSVVNRQKNQCRSQIFDVREQRNQYNAVMYRLRKEYLLKRKKYDEKLKVYKQLLVLKKLKEGSDSKLDSPNSALALIMYGLTNAKTVSSPGDSLQDRLCALNRQLEKLAEDTE